MKKLKLLSIIAIVTFIFSSCDPESCVDYEINNTTENIIEIKYYKINDNYSDTIQSFGFKNVLSVCGTGNSPRILDHSGNDSVQIIVNNFVKKTYYPSDEGKSIYKTQDRNSWKLVQANGEYSKFVFEINEEDLQ